MTALKLYDFQVTSEKVKLAMPREQAGKAPMYVRTRCTGMAVPELEGCQAQVAETVRKGLPAAMLLSC